MASSSAVKKKQTDTAKKRTSVSSKTKTPAARSPKKAEPVIPEKEPVRSEEVKERPNPLITREAALWLWLAACIFLFISYFGVGGYLGAALSDFSFGVFGVMAYIFPVLLFVSVAFWIVNHGKIMAGIKFGAAVVLYLCSCSFAALLTGTSSGSLSELTEAHHADGYAKGGGVIGSTVCGALCPAMGNIGTGILLAVLAIVCLVLITQKSLMGSMKKQSSRMVRSARESSRRRREAYRQQEDWFYQNERLSDDGQPGLPDGSLPGEQAQTFSGHAPEQSQRTDPENGYDSGRGAAKAHDLMKVERKEYQARRKGGRSVQENGLRHETARAEERYAAWAKASGNSGPDRASGHSGSDRTAWQEEREIDVPVIFPVQPRKQRVKHPVRDIGESTRIQGDPESVAAEVHEIFPSASSARPAKKAVRRGEEACFIDLEETESGTESQSFAGRADTEASGQSPEEVAGRRVPLHIEGIDTDRDPENEKAGDQSSDAEAGVSAVRFGFQNERKDNALALNAGQRGRRIHTGTEKGTDDSQQGVPDACRPVRSEEDWDEEEVSAFGAGGTVRTRPAGRTSAVMELSEAEESAGADLSDEDETAELLGKEENTAAVFSEEEEDAAVDFSEEESSAEERSATGDISEKSLEKFMEKSQESSSGSGKKRHSRSTQAEIEEGIASVEAEMAQAAKTVQREYVFPPLNLLKKGTSGPGKAQEKEIRQTAAKLQQTLDSFGVGVTVTNVSCGPSVTRYELLPEQGVKVSRIVALSDDIKLNLAAADIRIEAPIPGKSAVGIEVPNAENSTVALRDLIESDEFQKHKSKLAFATGKDIGGRVVVSDIAKMPHLLIAGATGSGKSVCINTLIMSILYKAKPDEVKLIMIDPKVVELSVYNGIPHLFIPVVTDPKKAAGALNWAVAEMTDRYNKFAEFGVRDLKGYNQKIETALAGVEDENKPQKLPQIVIIVDELADLMMVAPGEVEDAICRLAQLARAAGLHLIIATQRPSVNVITGLIKANMPSRIAFSVSSGVDSRTIIDMNGAEKLLGKGDMLFYPQGYQKPARVQGAFVSDEEVSDVVDFLKEQNSDVSYDHTMQEQIAKVQQAAAATRGAEDTDELFADAGKFIIEKDKASIGMLQRVFKIGFNRAARIMDQLADAGVVGPEEGTKPRKILMSEEEFENYIEQN